VTVVTGDRDLTQLTSNKTTVMVTKHGVSDLEAYTPEHMKKVNGVTPTEFIDMKALMGDNSDNYPGVTKIGPKTASNLIQKYGSIENLYDHIDDMKKSKRKENLIKDKDKAFLAKKLATIDRNAPVTIGLKDVKRKPVDYKKLRQFYEQMNFRKFLGELNASGEGQDGAEVEKVKYTELDQSNAKKISVKENDTVSFYLEMLGDNYHLAEFVGFALKINEQVYVSRDVSLLQENNLKHLLEDAEINKNVFDLKRTTVGLNRIDVHAHGLNYDMLLASYLVNNENNSN
ncbi:5'-3' exonuclease H3TH domain-containing protein, partial [Lactobacillus acetotolerans]